MSPTSHAPLLLTGRDLTPDDLALVARPGGRVALAAQGLDRMAASRAVIMAAVAGRVPMYGVTTGLGARVTEALDEPALAAFSRQTLRGRAQAIGTALPAAVVRGAMIVRANTLLLGASGAAPAVAGFLADCVNRDLTPVVPELGSIGTSDLLLAAVLGNALAGEGEILDAAGVARPAEAALRAAGLAPLELGPRDGLALCGHDGISATQAALGVAEARRVLAASQAAAALSCEGFRANLSPLRAEVLAFRPQAGEAEAAAGLRHLLAGSRLSQPGQARRLQDPLSFRTLAQVHGAIHAALAQAEQVVRVEINGASDNPVVLPDSGEVVSVGNFHNPHLTLATEQLARALVFGATLQAARIARLLAARFTDLPPYLARQAADSAGFAPLLKLAESLLARIQAEAAPVPLWPSISADGVEDALTQAQEAARRLLLALAGCRQLAALELTVAAQAVELRELGDGLAPRLRRLLAKVRQSVAPLGADRPLGSELTALAEVIAAGGLGDLDCSPSRPTA
jgi:histidine ammonia-lyase